MTERTMIIDALIRILVLLATGVLLPALKSWIDRNRDNRELQLVLQMADIAVRSVADDLKTADGQVKKDEALSRLAAQIASWGLKGFTQEELIHYIGTAYTEMKQNELPEPLPIIVDTSENLD